MDFNRKNQTGSNSQSLPPMQTGRSRESFMREIPTFQDVATLEIAFLDWCVSALQEYNAHAANVSKSLPAETIYLRDAAIDATNALTWAKDLEAEAEDWESQAMGILTESLTVAQAKGKAHQMVRVHKMLKRLSESGDRKLSALQSLMRT